MIGKLLILCIGLAALWAGASRIGRALGLQPFIKVNVEKQKTKPFFSISGFKITRFEAIITALVGLYVLWGLTQLF
tara:strand:+ start:148 stop:375 length:228 start_codon:yes stop_codon:yes gene_type:complete